MREGIKWVNLPRVTQERYLTQNVSVRDLFTSHNKFEGFRMSLIVFKTFGPKIHYWVTGMCIKCLIYPTYTHISLRVTNQTSTWSSWLVSHKVLFLGVSISNPKLTTQRSRWVSSTRHPSAMCDFWGQTIRCQVVLRLICIKVMYLRIKIQLPILRVKSRLIKPKYVLDNLPIFLLDL